MCGSQVDPWWACAENALVSAPNPAAFLRLTCQTWPGCCCRAGGDRRDRLGGHPRNYAAGLVFPLIMLMQMLSAGAIGGGVSSAISRALGAA